MAVLLGERRTAMIERQIVDELVAGNVMTGAKQQTPKTRAWNVKQSIKANVKNGKLRKVGDKYGLKDWDESFFI